jgi:uncharacterized protein
MTARMLVALLLIAVLADAQPPRGTRPKGGVKGDQTVFHFLLRNHTSIRRTVKRLDNGVETLTESNRAEVAAKIQEHVAAMHQRVKDGRGLRFWDELFVALFRNHAKITMTVENTKTGVRVKETSDDAFTVKLIQAHADVVSAFVRHGFAEAHKNHNVPAEGGSKPRLTFPIVPGVGGVVPLPKAAEPPRKGAKVVFDITADSKAGDVNRGLERVARLLNLYGAAGLKASDVKIALVLHGEATRAVLIDEAYREKAGANRNPNLPVIHALRKAGVEVYVCGQALAYKGFADSDVARDVPIAAAALSVIVNRQSDGYAYVPVP